MSSFYRQQLEEWLKNYEVKASLVYDVGGQQLPVDGRVGKWQVSQYEILDLPDFDVERKDSKFALLPRADITFCLETLEYCINPVIAFHNLAVITKPEGKIIISVPQVYPAHNELDKDSLRLTESGIKRLAALISRRPTFHYRRDKSGLLKQFYATDGMRAAKE